MQLQLLMRAAAATLNAAQAAAEVPLITYMVNVTNTGGVDSDNVVLGFLVPPGAGENGVPLQSLFAFERVHIKAGETRSVELYPEMDQFSQVDGSGARIVHPGEYTFKFGVKETVAQGGGFVEHNATML